MAAGGRIGLLERMHREGLPGQLAVQQPMRAQLLDQRHVEGGGAAAQADILRADAERDRPAPAAGRLMTARGTLNKGSFAPFMS